MIKNLTYKKFGRLHVLKFAYSKNGRAYWKCKCNCGNIKIIQGRYLSNGDTKSCGCLNIQRIRQMGLNNKKDYTDNNYKKLYYIWKSMKSRCYNTKNSHYNNYGARGIIICNEWLNDFMEFYTWAINNGYKENLSIDRINNDGNYEPNNCRWTTRKVQQNNKRNNILIDFCGETDTLANWATKKNIRIDTLWRRLKVYKWSIEKALTVKVNKLGGYNEKTKEVSK